MGIHRLPEELSRKIAAGEVIERPLSVVKELIENSIDAGAHSIEVELVQGGKVLISVRDDGCGIAPEDLPLAVEKYATSKISTDEDLEAISTLGYRGEALSSVGAVSELEIFSRRAETGEGACLRYENGEAKISSVPLRPGTTVIVKDLFYNLPARRKFLKTASAEFRRISRLVQDYSFAYPGISFSLVHGGKTVFKSSGSGSLKKLLADVWGDEPEIRAACFATGNSSAALWWQDTGPQTRFQLISFVNGRRVGDAVIRSAIASFHWATRGNWLVMLTLPPEDVDVNIHPAKAEILFRHSGDVFDLVRKATEKFSRDFSELPGVRNFSLDKNFSSFDVRPASPTQFSAYKPQHEAHPFSRIEDPVFRCSSPNAYTLPKEQSAERLPFNSWRDETVQKQPEKIESFDTAGPRFICQLSQGYLLFADAGGVLIVDPHAAHERINYERILKACSDPAAEERLIIPIQLPPTLKDAALANRNQLAELRFSFDDAGALITLPMHNNAAGIGPIELLRSAVSAVEERSEGSESLLHRFAVKACKASVKLTTRLEPSEALQLLSDLEKCDQPSACPHGRPTVLRLTGAVLDKHFGRLGL